MLSRAEMIQYLDNEADRIRALVVGDPVRTFEYQWAEQEARAFIIAGYQGDIPISVASWADAKSWTPQQAADDILAAATVWRQIMAAIRTNRLVGKENIRNAETVEDAYIQYQTYIGIFNGIIQQIGIGG